MKNVKNILLDYAWEIHELCAAESAEKSKETGVNHGYSLDVAIGMFCNQLDDVNVKNDPHVYDGIELDWKAIAEEYGWNMLSEKEKKDIQSKHDKANDMHRKEIGAAHTNGNKARLMELYRDAYAKLG